MRRTASNAAHGLLNARAVLRDDVEQLRDYDDEKISNFFSLWNGSYIDLFNNKFFSCFLLDTL